MQVADPRAQVVDGLVAGARCTRCRYPTAPATAWCPRCQAPQEPAAFGPAGTVWSATVVHIPVGDRRPPYAVAYVDLDDGPRLLAQLSRPVALAPGTRVRVIGTDRGDPLVEAVAGGVVGAVGEAGLGE